MKISIIQDQAVFRCGEKYYRKSLTELEKYLKLCEYLIYCCSIKEITQEEAQGMKEIDSSKVSIVELKKEKLFISKQTKKIVKEVILNSDLVFVKMPSFTIGRYALHLLNKTKVKYVTEVVGDAFDVYWYYSLKGKLISIPSFLISRYYIKKSKSVIYVTDTFLQKRYPTNGLSLSCSNVRIEIPKNFDGNYSDTNLLKICTISPVDRVFRGHDTVLKAIALLKDKGIRVQYFLVGGGTPERLKAISSKLSIQDEVFFLGELTHDKVISFLNTIDVYVHPSKAEGLPRALIEAMSRGKLSIGARTGGIPELLSDEYIFDKGDYRKLSSIIEKINSQDIYIQGHLNYLRSLQFEKFVLDSKRKNFIDKLLTL